MRTKKEAFISIICILICISIIIPSFPLRVKAEELSYFDIDGVDIAVQKNSAVVFTATASGLTEGYELSVNAEGVVIASGGVNNIVPEGGFVVAATGTKAYRLKKFASIGDTVIFHQEELMMLCIPDDYNPFYTDVMQYNAINSTRTENTTIIYKDKAATGTNVWGIEAVVDSEGFVISIGSNNNLIPDKGFVISCVGNKKAELEAKIVLGLQVKLNEATKTLELAYTKESLLKQLEISYNTFAASLKEAKDSFSLIDYTLAEEYRAELEGLLNQASISIGNNDLRGFYIAKSKFDIINKKAEPVLLEIPAVEGRALWLRPAERTRDAVNKTVKDVYDMGYNIICLEILYNNTMIIPMPDGSLFSQNPSLNGFDVLAAYIDECHRYGIELHAWMSVYRVGHDASNYPELGIGNKKPEWRIISKTGLNYVYNAYGNSHYLNPALPEVKDYLLSVYKYILESYSVDGFQLDYIRYPENSSDDYGYDQFTRDLYIEKTGIDPITISKGGAGWAEWCAFRAEFVTDLVISVKNLISEIRPDVLLSCDVAPKYDESSRVMMQDSTTWLKNEYIGCIYPMAYGTDVVQRYTQSTVELAGEGVYTYIGVADYGTELLKKHIMQTRNYGADGVAFFSYNQYISGGYQAEISRTVFSKKALSPTYNARQALILQLETAIKRMNEVIKLDSFSDKNSAYDLEEALQALKIKLEGTEISEATAEIESLNTKYDTFAVMDGAEADAVKKDLRLVFKLINNNLDDEKNEYYMTHPLPEKYQENNTSEAESLGEVSSIESNDKPSRIWIPILGAALAVGAVTALIAVLKAKHSKENR